MDHRDAVRLDRPAGHSAARLLYGHRLTRNANGDHRAAGEGKTGRLAENRISDGWRLTARPADFPDLSFAVEAWTSRVRKWQKLAGSPNLIELTF